MVLVLPCGVPLSNQCNIPHDNRPSRFRRTIQPFGNRGHCRKENKVESDLICDSYARRSAMRCQSVAHATENVVVNATQSDTSGSSDTDRSRVLIRLVEPSELEEVAWLRAEAYYEVGIRSFRVKERSQTFPSIRLSCPCLQDQPHIRYVGSFKRQFKEQEARSLKERIRCRPGSIMPECVCLVAVEEGGGSGVVMGTLDAEPPGSPTPKYRDIPEVCGLALGPTIFTGAI